MLAQVLWRGHFQENVHEDLKSAKVDFLGDIIPLLSKVNSKLLDTFSRENLKIWKISICLTNTPNFFHIIDRELRLQVLKVCISSLILIQTFKAANPFRIFFGYFFVHLQATLCVAQNRDFFVQKKKIQKKKKNIEIILQ